MKRMKLLLVQIIVVSGFILAYCIQPILVDVIKFSGGAHSSTFLILLPHYYAMVLVGLLPKDRSLLDCGWTDWKKGLLLSSLDVINQLLKKAGLVFAGAGVYIIVESSSMVWTVLWSKLLLQKRLNFAQWLSILLVTAGIALRSCQLTFQIENEEFFGVVLILASSILMGLTFVLFEMFVNHPTEAVPGPTLVFMMGSTCAVLMTGWQVVWTVPRFDQLVLQTIHEKQGNPWYVLICYIFLFISGWIHSATLWYLLKVLGAVSSGVLKGLKVAGVFVLSHILFCEIQPSQCLNIWSGASATVCTVGVIVYSIITASSLSSSTSSSAFPLKWLQHGEEEPTETFPLLLDKEILAGKKISRSPIRQSPVNNNKTIGDDHAPSNNNNSNSGYNNSNSGYYYNNCGPYSSNSGPVREGGLEGGSQATATAAASSSFDPTGGGGARGPHNPDDDEDQHRRRKEASVEEGREEEGKEEDRGAGLRLCNGGSQV
eukprot:GHVS01030271.1.p1 GENE.GHVS01030271.1~~GHVS01030271.1.p1  ORF type:complete len:487 (+),score=91.96 GHVS01030271.1:89-1549(+)